MKKLLLFILVLTFGITLYFYLDGGDKIMSSVPPTQAAPSTEAFKSQVTVEHDFDFSSQEREQMTPVNTTQSQAGNSVIVEQVFSPPPER